MGSGETTPEIVVWPENDKYCVNRSYGVDRMYDYLDEFSTFKEALDFIKSIIKEDFPTEFKYPKNYYGRINIGSIVFCSDRDSASDHVGLVVRDETNFRKLLSDLRESKISPADIFSEKFQEENESRYSRSEILEKAIKEAETSDWDRQFSDYFAGLSQCVKKLLCGAKGTNRRKGVNSMPNFQEFAWHFWPKKLVFNPHSLPPLAEEILSVKRKHSFFEYAAVGILMVSMSSFIVYVVQNVDPRSFVVYVFFYLVFVMSFGGLSVGILRHVNSQDYADIPLAKAEDVFRVFSSHPLLWEYFTAIKKQGRLPARYEYKGATRYSLLNAQEKESFQQNMLSDEPNFSTKHPVDMD